MWIDELCKNNNNNKIDVDDKDIILSREDKILSILSNNDKLKTTLFQHQIKDIDAMLQLENRRCVVYGNDKDILYTNAGVLSEPYGSGKTFIIMGLIACCPIPKQYIDTHVLNMSGDDKKSIQDKYDKKYIKNTSCVQINRKFKNIVKPALIFCSSSVAIQWGKTLDEYSNLKYMIITDVFGIKRLYNMLIEDFSKINEYDAIIVKNKVITGEFNYSGYVESHNNTKTRYIINIISNISINLGITWSRLILDDFDTIYSNYISQNSGVVNCSLISALFTWVVSGSSIVAYLNTSFNNYTSMQKLLDYNNFNFRLIYNNKFLWSIFNISCSKTFTEACVSIGKPEFKLSMFKNPNDSIINLIGELGNDNIVEMLNGDALETAAETAGIKSTKVCDIFEKILGDNYSIYSEAVAILNFISSNSKYYLLPKPSDCENNNKPVYTMKNLINRDPIEYSFPNLDKMFKDTYDKYNKAKHDSGIALERVKDKIRDGVCAVCDEEITEVENTIISKCCGVLLCGHCGVVTSLNRRKCANCTTHLEVNDVIFIGEGFNLDKIVQDDIDYEHDRVINTEPEYLKTKIDVLIDLINGDTNYPTKIVYPKLNQKILMGTTDLPEASVGEKSFVVFASYEESLDAIKKEFDKNNISYIRLRGTAKDMSDTVDEFNKSNVKVLLLNTSKHCAGLNLQKATDLVFMHKVIDPNFEGQAIGRLQRCYRKYKAHIWYLLYNNELEYFSFN